MSQFTKFQGFFSSTILIPEIVGHPFSRPFQLGMAVANGNVKGIFEGTRPIREGTTAIGLGALAYV
jgi:hypothetical protein